MNPLNNVIFAQRVIAFSAINLKQPLLCTLVTPSWAEAVFDYGAAALAWKSQITQTPDEAQQANGTDHMKSIDMIDEDDDDESDLAGYSSIKEKRAARFAAHLRDTIPARVFKAKLFLFRLLFAGQGRLQAWALQQLMSDALGYFELLPIKQKKKKADENQSANNGGWGMAGVAAQPANTNENLDVDPQHWKGALIKQLIRGQWAEGARVLLLDPRIPRPSATEDIQQRSHGGWPRVPQSAEGNDEKIPPLADLLCFAAKSKDRSGNVLRLLLTDKEIHQKVGDFTNEYVVNTMFQDDWKCSSAVILAGVANNPTTVRLLLEAGAEMKILVKNRPWIRRSRNNNNNNNNSEQQQVRRLRRQITGQMSSLIVNVIEANCADALRAILTFLRDTQGQEALDDLFYKTGRSQNDLRENVKFFTETSRPGISIPKDATFASSIAAMKEGDFIVLSASQSERDCEAMPQFIATRQMRYECIDVLLREFKVDPNYSDWGSGLYGPRCSMFCSVISRLAQVQTFRTAEQDRNGTSLGANMFGVAGGSANGSADEAEQKAKNLIRFMIDECGADVNGFDKKRNVQGKSPLEAALEGQGDLALLKYLIEECGADPFGPCRAPSIRNLVGFSARVPWDKEARIKDRSLKFSIYSPAWGAPARTREEEEREEDDYPFDLEWSRFYVYALDKSNGSPFVHIAAEQSDPDVCTYLFKELPDKLNIPRSAVSNSCDSLGQTPLFLACSRFPYFWQRLNFRVPDIVKFLIQECDALVDVKRHGDELQPIHCLTSLNAGRDATDDILAIFIQNGADINARTAVDAGYDTPLHFYAAKGDRTMVRAALDAGANVNAKNTNNMTPIMAALTVMDRYSVDENGQYGQYCFDNGAHVWNIHAILRAGGNRACPHNPARSTFRVEQSGGAKIDAEFDGAQDTTSLVDGMAPQSVYDLVEAVGKKGLSKVFRKERSRKEKKR